MVPILNAVDRFIDRYVDWNELTKQQIDIRLSVSPKKKTVNPLKSLGFVKEEFGGYEVMANVSLSGSKGRSEF